MKVVLAMIPTFLILIIALIWWVCTHVIFETHEVTNVKNLMVVQHFNSGQFAQIVDMSMLESHGLAKLDQYFVDIPFTEEEMIEGGFQRRDDYEGAEGAIIYWKMVKNSELILVKSPQGNYWLWGREEEDDE